MLTSDAAGNASWQTPSLNINWINPVQTFSMGLGHHSNAPYDPYPINTTNYNWQTINISSYVPAGTKNVLVEVDYAISAPDGSGDVDAFVLVRANSSSPTIPIARGRSSGNGDNVAGLNTAIIPIDQSTRTFQLAVEFPGFNGGVTVRLLAYF